MNDSSHPVFQRKIRCESSPLFILKLIRDHLSSLGECGMVQNQSASTPMLCMEGKVTDRDASPICCFLIVKRLHFDHYIGGGRLKDDGRKEWI